MVIPRSLGGIFGCCNLDKFDLDPKENVILIEEGGERIIGGEGKRETRIRKSDKFHKTSF